MTKVIDAFAGETIYAYDEIGNKISQTDPNGHSKTWEYDNHGRVVEHTLPFGMFETHSYDPAGNLISKADFNGDAITYVFDVSELSKIPQNYIFYLQIKWSSVSRHGRPSGIYADLS